LLIAFPNADDPPSGNHESRESKIPKRKKARPNTRFPAKSNTLSRQLLAISQADLHSSQTTKN